MFLVIGEMYVRNNRLTNADTKVFNSIFLACCTDINYKRLNRCGTSILTLSRCHEMRWFSCNYTRNKFAIFVAYKNL